MSDPNARPDRNRVRMTGAVLHRPTLWERLCNLAAAARSAGELPIWLGPLIVGAGVALVVVFVCLIHAFIGA